MTKYVPSIRTAGLRAGALLLVAVLAVALAAPAAAAGWRDRAAGPLRPLSAATTVDDPTGDTLPTLGLALDVTSFSATVENQDLVFELVFDGGVSGADSGEADALAGKIDIDTDQDPATGELPNVDLYSPNAPHGLGSEFFVDLTTYDSATGDADLFDPTIGLVAGRVPVSFTADTCVVTVPLALLGDEGVVHAATVVGNLDDPTDVVPNQGFVVSSQGTPIGPVFLNNGRFEVEIAWRDFFDNTGQGRLAVRSDDSANFWFFNPENWEMLVKVLDGCATNGHFWVFAAATTNVEYTLRVTDTLTDETAEYFNPLRNSPVALTDTAAFETCP